MNRVPSFDLANCIQVYNAVIILQWIKMKQNSKDDPLRYIFVYPHFLWAAFIYFVKFIWLRVCVNDRENHQPSDIFIETQLFPFFVLALACHKSSFQLLVRRKTTTKNCHTDQEIGRRPDEERMWTERWHILKAKQWYRAGENHKSRIRLGSPLNANTVTNIARPISLR